MIARLVNPAGLTGRRTLTAWWCPNGTRNDGTTRICGCCDRNLIERHAQVHASERAVVFRHPVTGEIRRPARADQPMDPMYAAQGFQREEIMSMTQHEKETGSVHEATNFSPGNEPSPDREPTPSVPKEVREALIKDVMDAHQSGNWTMDRPLMDAPIGS